MKPRLPRFTLRRLMIAVAIVGLILGLALRRERFRRLSIHHLRKSLLSNLTRTRGGCGVFEAAGARDRIDIETLAREEEFHQVLYEKYLRAAQIPWFPVPADPTEPGCYWSE